ncbi:hypothetical protein A2160_05810 [Candidatus Beckwithbacteria bacterium RBG_13_42_9]|uniref:Glutamyl-tRNA amidotransferase n=1 Tax=Candidatus Beckwithbacteria bacterium RBG_13_42_9 TaxID=1797457 RepID=A0A1F5E6B7_9BACT|nr:MAG: hypothetical protein A2160_05810 [Candidatus Beckwithbacteria bacterium RBG_13_42_9]
MSLQEQIQQEIIEALKSKDENKVQTLRLVMAQIKDAQIEKRALLTDEEVIKVLGKIRKQHEEAIALYHQGKREDLVAQEEAEKKIIEAYLPSAMSEAEINALIDQTITQIGKGNFGQLMGIVMKKTSGRADGKVVAELVKKKMR